jgi:lipopolysaccharide biosynthesis glycosyltransferase
MQGDDVEVLCACDQRFLPHAATMLCSLLEHNRVFRIHFLYSSIPSRELAKLKSLVARYSGEVAFYEIAPTDFADLHVDRWASTAVYYRLLAPRLLAADLSKVLYLDCDIIVRHSLNELWCTDITDHALAAITDSLSEVLGSNLGLPAGTKYFNSGVLLINLQFWRKNNIPDKVIAFVRNNSGRIPCWDQDALNAVLADQWIELPAHWNTQSASLPKAGMDPAVMHFTDAVKPWHRYSTHPFKNEYRKYRIKTPWGQYRQEGLPPFLRRVGPFARRVARFVVPGPLRRWLRSRLPDVRV